jgi:hypothetical protein
MWGQATSCYSRCHSDGHSHPPDLQGQHLRTCDKGHLCNQRRLIGKEVDHLQGQAKEVGVLAQGKRLQADHLSPGLSGRLGPLAGHIFVCFVPGIATLPGS